MKPLKYTLLFIILLTNGTQALAETKRVAMLISSNGTETNPELSYDLEELAQSYLVLHDNGVAIDIISPKGGAVLVKNNKDDLAYIQRFKSLALNKLQNTLSVSQVSANTYDGIFIIGGGGAMIDLPSHQPTQELLTDFAKHNAVITAVCHGPAAIANIKVDGEYFVAGKQVNSFTNLEDKAFSSESIAAFPFMNEDLLQANGAKFVSNAPMLPYIAVDGNLITAQNPMSVPRAAEATVLKLGLPLQQRTLFKDEATMDLIARARNSGASLIDIALATQPERYDMNYLGLYGFYAYRLATPDTQSIELSIMETIGNHFAHPMYEVALIQAMVEQNHIEKAKLRFEQFAVQYPENDAITQLKTLVGA